MKNISRRRFLQTTAAATIAAGCVPYVRAASKPVLGQGDFRYRVVPDWGVLGTTDTPVKNCSAIVCDRQGHIILLTDHTKNNVIVYDRRGKLVHKWGTQFPGAHGLSIVTENKREVLFITDLNTHKVTKTTLDGTVLNEWGWPSETGKYKREDEYRPSWTLHLPDGDFFVFDGYGKDYIMHYSRDGKLLNFFGGPEGGIKHWGPHGGMIDFKDGKPTLLIAMSDQQYMLRLSLDGAKMEQIDYPGGNPRQLRTFHGHYYLPHIGDNWPKDYKCHGFLSVLDSNLRIVSNIAGTPPVYDDHGQLQPMRHTDELFQHPHDLVVDKHGSIYVAQFDSGQTYLIKLERV